MSIDVGDRWHVLLLANTLPPFDLSGAGEQVVQLAAGLRLHGHRVELMGRGSAGVAGGKLLFPLRAVLPVLRWLRTTSGRRVVQVHESDGGLVVLAVRLWRWMTRSEDVRVVALQQVTYREEFGAVNTLRNHLGEVVARPTGAELVFRWARAPLHWILGVATARFADRVMVPSAQTGREVQRDYGARSVAVVPNVRAPTGSGAREADKNSISDEIRGIAAAGKYLLFVGRLRIRKGVEYLLRGLLEVPEARLLIVGDGERGEALDREVRHLGLQERVVLVGRRQAEEIQYLLARSAALVVPSTYEGMPLVILEAMEESVPVIATRVSGIPEVVVDGETGWLFRAGDTAQLAELMRCVLENPERARAMGEAGRRRLEASYRPRDAVDSWLQALGLSE